MQAGWVERHRQGWRGGWRERGTKRYTTTVKRRGDARGLLHHELARLDAGAAHQPTLTFTELVGRFTAQYDASEKSKQRIRFGLAQPLNLWGETLADQVTPELVNRWLLNASLRPATKQTYLRTLRQVYGFGVDNRLVSDNPAKRVKTPTVRRSDRLLPFESWEQVERVAAEAGRWGAMIIFAVDTGARPGELCRLEHRHIHEDRCYLPGTKTRHARRVVTLTPRGIAAYQSIPRSERSPLVFHWGGLPVDFNNWRNRVWRPALATAGLDYRAPYQMRHSFAYFSLMAGVPLSDLAVEMGHESIKLSHETYGHWSDDMGDRAARLRATWAAKRPPTGAER